MRNRTPPAKRLSAIPDCSGLMTRLCCAHAQSAGLDLAPILREAGLVVRDIEDETVRLSVATQIKCLNLLAQALGDRLLGFHVALTMDLRRTGLLYYVAASSDNIVDAVQGIARCSAMLNEGIRLETVLGQTLRIGFGYAGVSRRSDRHQIEAWTTAIVRCCREITGRGLQPVAVRILHPRIPESGELDGFFGRSVDFSAGRDEIAFAGVAAKVPVVNADRYLNRLVVGFCEDVLARRKARSGVIQADVENAVAALLPHGQPGIEDVAQKLRIGTRTLRRKLAAEGVTFARILEDLRFALARHYLAEQDFSISRIAWLLGYTEVSAFSHAFRRWTGRTPRADRSRRRRSVPPLPAKRRARR
jgi:AraC-like DNA-binding protein